MTTFRPHRGSLEDSMKNQVEMKTWEDLIAYIVKNHFVLTRNMDLIDDMYSEPYAVDTRTGWEAWIITIPGYGVVGFSNGMLAGAKRQRRLGNVIKP